MTPSLGRTERRTLLGLGAGLAAAALAAPAEASTPSLQPASAKNLAALTAKLATLPRRRDFKTVPMILRDRAQWDAEALDAVLGYRGGPRQAWDNTDIHGSWLNVMRNSLNAQIWSFNHPDFLCVSATHGSAQLALYDQAAWEKYGLAKMAGHGIAANHFLDLPKAAGNPADIEAPSGAYSLSDNSVAALHARGAVFLACHNAVWEQAAHLVQAGANPDHASVDVVAADLTNHLAPFVVLTPGAVATIVELHTNGFAYTR